jgi:hypothetical protein
MLKVMLSTWGTPDVETRMLQQMHHLACWIIVLILTCFKRRSMLNMPYQGLGLSGTVFVKTTEGALESKVLDCPKCYAEGDEQSKTEIRLSWRSWVNIGRIGRMRYNQSAHYSGLHQKCHQ